MGTEPHVVVIGAGPVGLTAAAHLSERQLRFTVLEAGHQPGASIRQWGHVRLFSSWAMDTDPVASALLARVGQAPPEHGHPTGHELVDHYVAPLAHHPAIAPHLHLGATVTAVTRKGRSRLDSRGRDAAPFVVRYTSDGGEHEIKASAVIDASGTWASPTRSVPPVSPPGARPRRPPTSGTASPTSSAPNAPATPPSASPDRPRPCGDHDGGATR